MEYISKSEKQTQEIAFEYAKTLKKGDVVILNGDLGAGKTAFTKGVAKAFNLPTQKGSCPELEENSLTQ